MKGQCPKCNGLFNAKPEWIGKQARCPHCQEMITVQPIQATQPNAPAELKVPILDSTPSDEQIPKVTAEQIPKVTAEQTQKAKDFDPELPSSIKMLNEMAASPSSKLLLVALKAGGYLCALPPILSLFWGLFHFNIGSIISFISTTIAFASSALILFSLEKILTAIMAAHEEDQQN
jgi:hypothetical protein